MAAEGRKRIGLSRKGLRSSPAVRTFLAGIQMQVGFRIAGFKMSAGLDHPV
jgi:hypothetical protein